MDTNNIKNIVNSGQNCSIHKKEPIWEEEICRDYNPLDEIAWTEYFVSYCKRCENRENKLNEKIYYQKLAEEEGIPDLKYWKVYYSRDNRCFVLKIDNIRNDEITSEEDVPETWSEKLSQEDMKTINLDLASRSMVITRKLKKLAKTIRKDRELSNSLIANKKKK